MHARRTESKRIFSNTQPKRWRIIFFLFFSYPNVHQRRYMYVQIHITNCFPWFWHMKISYTCSLNRNLSSSSAYCLKYGRATDSHGAQRQYLPASAEKPRQHVSMPRFLLSPLSWESRWTVSSGPGFSPSLVYSLYYHSGHRYYRLAARLAPVSTLSLPAWLSQVGLSSVETRTFREEPRENPGREERTVWSERCVIVRKMMDCAIV